MQAVRGVQCRPMNMLLNPWRLMLPPVLAVLATACAAGAAPSATQADRPDLAKELKVFPVTMPGHRREVIELPALPNEDERKIELIGGKAMNVDCNARGMDGQFESHDVPGWGYTYWVFKSSGQALSTMMACPPGSAKPGFVQAQPLWLRYNSRLPVVVFVPEGMQLRWRVWQAGAMQEAAPR